MSPLLSNSCSFVALYIRALAEIDRVGGFEVCRGRCRLERKESWTCQLELEILYKPSGVPEASAFKSEKEQLFMKE